MGKFVGKNRSVRPWCIVALVMAGLLSACSQQAGVTGSGGSNGEKQSGSTTTQTKASVQHLQALQALGVPEAETKEALAVAAKDRTDWQLSIARAHCLIGKGWQPELDRAHPGNVGAATIGRAEARRFADDVTACDTTLGVHDLPPLGPQEYRKEYALDVKRHACLKKEGIALPDMPSEATYIERSLESAASDVDTGFRSVRGQLRELVEDEPEFRRLSLACLIID